MKELLLILIIILIFTRCSGRIEQFIDDYGSEYDYCNPISKENRKLYAVKNDRKFILIDKLCKNKRSSNFIEDNSKSEVDCYNELNKYPMDELKKHAETSCKYIDDLTHSNNIKDYNWKHYCNKYTKSGEDSCVKCLTYNGIRGKDWSSTLNNCSECCESELFKKLRYNYDVGKAAYISDQKFESQKLHPKFIKCNNLERNNIYKGLPKGEFYETEACNLQEFSKRINDICKNCIYEIPEKEFIEYASGNTDDRNVCNKECKIRYLRETNLIDRMESI